VPTHILHGHLGKQHRQGPKVGWKAFDDATNAETEVKRIYDAEGRTLIENVQRFSVAGWHAALDGAVNKRFLSTGETRELVRVNVGFDSNPRVVCVTQQDLASNWREGAARKNLRNVGDTRGVRKSAAVNKTRPRSWGGSVLAPFVGDYRTFLASPTPEGRAILGESVGLQRCF
jgi:hypothetical protein